MGNYKFRLSDMIPNAWFYKLKDMSSTRNQGRPKNKHQPTLSSSSSTAAPAQQSKGRQTHQRKSSHAKELSTTPQNQHTFLNNVTTIPKASDTHFPDPPRKSSSKKRRSTKRNRPLNRPSPRLVTTSVSAGCNCRATIESVWINADSTPEYPNSPADSSSGHESLLPEIGSDLAFRPGTFDGMVSLSASCRSSDDIVIELANQTLPAKSSEIDGIDAISELELPPIITKPDKLPDMLKDLKQKENIESTKCTTRSSSFKVKQKNAQGSLSVKVIKEDISSISSRDRTSPVSRFHVNSQGVKLRTNSPRIGSRKIQSIGRKSVSSSASLRSRRSTSETLAVVKSSQDPQTDFKESMVEMIMENNIRTSKDLEELLACYLSLNSNEYHEVIIEVFKQIWFEINDIRLK